MTENANTIFLANYATHAQMWHIVDTGRFISDFDDEDMKYSCRDRDGRWIYVWFYMFHTYQDMENIYTQTRKFPDKIGESVETVVLTNEGKMGHYV